MRLSWLARNGRSPGEESRSDAVAAQAIEAQPSSGQISQGEAAWRARTEQHPREKTWRMSDVPHKSCSVGEEEKKLWRSKRRHRAQDQGPARSLVTPVVVEPGRSRLDEGGRAA